MTGVTRLFGKASVIGVRRIDGCENTDKILLAGPPSCHMSKVSFEGPTQAPSKCFSWLKLYASATALYPVFTPGIPWGPDRKIKN